MPLIQSCSADARRKNIAKLIGEGYPPDQAAAIAADLCRRLRRRTRADASGRELAKQTAQAVQIMRSVGIAKRPRKRLPRQRVPKGLHREYAQTLLKIVAQTKDALKPLLDALPDLLEAAARERRLDVNEGQIARTLIEDARRQMSAAVHPTALDNLLTRLSTRVARNNREQIRRQVRAALGADIFVSDAGLRPIMQGFAAENAALIKDIPDKIIGEVERATTRAISSGTLHRDLAKEINKRFAFGRDRARLIARDQVGKLYGQINSERQKRIGVTHFFWRTSKDERVRDEHEAIDGERFSYAAGGAPGEGMPGEPILCRCWADPDFSGILDRV